MTGVDIDMAEENIYDSDTSISEHTNRAVVNGSAEQSAGPIFWCEICQVRLRSGQTAIQHLRGKPHKGRMEKKKKPTDIQNNQNGTGKHKVDSGNTQNDEPVAKKIKPEYEQCEVCNLDFNTTMLAMQHYKGKRHAAAVTAKVEATAIAKAEKYIYWRDRREMEMRRGSGRGGTGRGVGGQGESGRGGRWNGEWDLRGRGRGSGGFSSGEYSNNRGLGRGAAAGQLVRALQNFYGQSTGNSLDTQGYNSLKNSPSMQYGNTSGDFSAGSNDLYRKSGTSTYGTSTYGTSTYPNTGDQGRTSYDFPSSSTMNNTFSGGSNNRYSRDYWRK